MTQSWRPLTAAPRTTQAEVSNDSEVLVTALADCLDALEQSVTGAILLAITVVWPALRNQDTLEVHSLKIERRYAFPVLATLYMFSERGNIDSVLTTGFSCRFTSTR
jgi:hypothetical protein